jgi:hypothetical protein
MQGAEMLKQSVLLFASWSFCGLSAFAVDFPPAYDAIYEQDNAGQKITTKVASDGRAKSKPLARCLLVRSKRRLIILGRHRPR